MPIARFPETPAAAAGSVATGATVRAMHVLMTELQRRLARWRADDHRVLPQAQAINLQRARWLAPAVAAVNLVWVLWLGVSLLLHGAAGPQASAQRGLLLTHLLLGLTFGLGAWVAQALRYQSKSFITQLLPLMLALSALASAVAMATLNQPERPGAVPFVLGVMAVTLLMLWRPSVSAATLALSYGLLHQALARTQHDAAWLLSQRLDGLWAVLLGWAVSVLVWRQFVAVQLSQEQLRSAQDELQTRQKELQRLTRQDGLTGLYNRSTFVELTRQELARAKRQGSSTSILLLDLDFFKHVNDTYGHPAGDAVLKNVAAVATSSVRTTDLVGRLGGEEFIILLPATTLEAARWLAEKLRAKMEKSSTVWGGQRITSTVSIGVASTSAAQQHDFDHLYTSADEALYRAKEKGRNRVE